MNLYSLQRIFIIVALLAHTSAQSEGQFEKLVTRRLPDLLTRSKATQEIVEVFAVFVAAVRKQLSDFIDMNNNDHARVHTGRIKNSTSLLKANVIQAVEHYRTLITDSALTTAIDALLKQLKKVYDDLNRVADILEQHNGSTYIWDLQSLGSRITGDPTLKYLLPEAYERLSALQWKDILTKRYTVPFVAQ